MLLGSIDNNYMLIAGNYIHRVHVKNHREPL